VAAFCRAFVEDWNTGLADASAAAEARKREIPAADRKLDNLVAAIADGVRAAGVQRKLEKLEARKAQLPAALEDKPAPVPALHPKLGDVHAKRIAWLRDAIEGGNAPEGREAARALIDEGVISPGEDAGDPPGIERVGRLMAMLKRPAGPFPARRTTLHPGW